VQPPSNKVLSPLRFGGGLGVGSSDPAGASTRPQPPHLDAPRWHTGARRLLRASLGRLRRRRLARRLLAFGDRGRRRLFLALPGHVREYDVSSGVNGFCSTGLCSGGSETSFVVERTNAQLRPIHSDSRG
jgi:hypothetical protein